MAKKTAVIQSQGKRKKAVARATLRAGSGKVFINGQALHNYANTLLRLRISEPLVLAGAMAKKVDVMLRVNGGGMSGQADACRLAIARALVAHDPKMKKDFEGYDRLLLVADVRQKEVCKPNDSKARSKRQKSYR